MLRSILLVEDNPHDAELVMMALERLSMANKIDHVKDGAEALDWLLRRNQYKGRTSLQPSAVFLDIKMPKMTGLEVLEQARASSELTGVPFVMLTNSSEPVDVGSAYRLGANAYVVKPPSYQEFVKALRDLGRMWADRNEIPHSSHDAFTGPLH